MEDRLGLLLDHLRHHRLRDPVGYGGNGQRPLLARKRTRLGNMDPPGRQRTVAALLQLAGQLTEQPVYPVLLGASQGDLIDARRAPLLRRTATHARCKTSLRRTLLYGAWNLRPGSALAARYSACCKARTGSPDTGDPFAAGLALTALTGLRLSGSELSSCLHSLQKLAHDVRGGGVFLVQDLDVPGGGGEVAVAEAVPDSLEVDALVDQP